MKKILILSTFMMIIFSSCTSTFAGSLFFITPREIVYYLIFAFFISAAMAIFHLGERFMGMKVSKKGVFWLSFIMNVLLTPVAGLIYFFFKFIENNK